MSDSLFNILAATRSGGDGQWVVGVVVFAIWALLSVVGAATKKKEQQKRDQVRQTLENLNVPPAQPIRTAPPIAPVRRAPAPALAPEIARRVPPAMKVRPVQNLPRGAKVAPRGATPQKIAANIASAIAAKAIAARAVARAPALSSASPATSSSASVPVSMTATRPDIAASEIRSEGAPVARVPSTDAAALKRWLKPETLRQQFILTEILQQPIALRPQIGLTSHA